MRKSLILLLITLVSVGIVSCSDDSPTGSNNNSTNSSGQPMPSFAIDPNEWGGTMATIKFDFVPTGLPPGIPFEPIEMTMGYAQFGENGKDAGAVTVNDKELGKVQSGSTIVYSSFSATNPTDLSGVEFDGSEHEFTSSGSADVPALSMSVVSPTEFTLTSPEPNATIKKSDGIRFTWSGGSASSSDSLFFTISPNENDKYAYVVQGIPNNGSYTIPASEISRYSGTVTLHAMKYRYATTTVNGKIYVAVAEVVKQIPVTLQ